MRTSEKPFLPVDIDLLCKIIDNAPDIIFTIDLGGKIQYVNSSFCKTLGYSREEIVGKNIRELAIDMSIYDACMVSVKETGKCLDQETYFKTKNKQVIHVIKSVNALYDETGKITTIIVNARDLTNVDKLNRELANIKQHLENRLNIVQQIFLNINEAVAIIDKDGCYIEQNKAHESLLGYTMEELQGKTPLIHMKKTDYEKAIGEVKEKGYFSGEFTIKTKNGTPKDIELIVFPVRDENGIITHYIGIKKDITDKKQNLYLDYLTKLPNRNKLVEDINKTFNPKVMIVNIDSFKEINDVYGFNIGDEILKKLGERLSGFIKTYNLSIYRIGGDEFAILMGGFFKQKDLETFINDLLCVIQKEPFYIEGYEINIDATIGIAIPKDFSGKSVLERADMALKYAKENRKPYFIYSEDIEIHKRFQENLKWVKVLKNAIEHKKLTVFYQPIFDNKTGKIVKYEALIRIKDGDNYISPFYFLDVAKKAKLYHHITQEVIEKSFETSKIHRVEVSINLSIKDILNESITSQIFKHLKKGGGLITFELLESEGIQNFEEVLEFIKDVKRYGVKVAIDDFGSGYSNFEYILKMNVDYLKIDASLIKGVHERKESRVIVETIVNFSKKLGIKTIAEHVHCEDVFNVVREMDVDYSQGFYLAEPSPKVKI